MGQKAHDSKTAKDTKKAPKGGATKGGALKPSKPAAGKGVVAAGAVVPPGKKRTIRRQTVAVAGRTVNTQWFKDRLADVGLSMRGLAGLIELDVSAVSLMLSGKRKMSVPEAGNIARHLGVPVEDVLRHAGADVNGVVAGAVGIRGWVDAAGKVHQGGAVGPATVVAPQGAPEGLSAVRVQGGLWDGWVAFYRDLRAVGAEAVGRLCLVQVAGQEGTFLRWVHKGYESGTWNLTPMQGSQVECATLASAAPVLWLKQ